jgi:hypothetical protein
MKVKHDLVGRHFGRWTVLAHSGFDRKRNTMWKCECSCGGHKIVRGQSLLCGDSKSCGCIHQERLRSESNRKHGLSGTPEYRALNQAVQRCKPDYSQHADYFDRGITVWAFWATRTKAAVQDFITYVGKRPSPQHSLDRIDNDKGYEPGNVRWATRGIQYINRRIKRIEQFSDAVIVAEFKRRGL